MHDLENTKRLLTAMVTAIIDHPEALEVRYEHIRGLTQWYVKVHGEDQGKVRGRKAAHIIAIQYLIEEIGSQHAEKQRVTLLEPDERVLGHRSPLRQAEAYNPSDAITLLHQILAQIFLEPAHITITSDETSRPLAYDFHIKTRNEADQEKLLCPYDDDQSKQTLIGALGTLWRAYANREGVAFKISTTSR